MNLRVDLILETEKRSASMLTPKMIVRLVSVVGPLLLVALIGWAVAKELVRNGELKTLEARWQATEPLEKKALQLSAEARANAGILAELKGWRHSHVNWSAALLELMRRVPAHLQLVELNLSQSFQVSEKGVPARVFAISLRGRTSGPEAENGVRSLAALLAEDAAFTNLVREVKIPTFAADTSEKAGKDDRVFEITCACREQPFE
jgi:hypothetical protein